MFDTMESKISRLAVFFLVMSPCLQLCVVCVDNKRIQIIETAPSELLIREGEWFPVKTRERIEDKSDIE